MFQTFEITKKYKAIGEIMENVIIRNIKEKDIPSVVDIQISGWQTAYKGIIDDKVLNSMNRDEKIKKKKRL